VTFPKLIAFDTKPTPYDDKKVVEKTTPVKNLCVKKFSLSPEKDYSVINKTVYSKKMHHLA